MKILLNYFLLISACFGAPSEPLKIDAIEGEIASLRWFSSAEWVVETLEDDGTYSKKIFRNKGFHILVIKNASGVSEKMRRHMNKAFLSRIANVNLKVSLPGDFQEKISDPTKNYLLLVLFGVKKIPSPGERSKIKVEDGTFIIDEAGGIFSSAKILLQ